MERFENENLSTEHTCLVVREEGVRVPVDDPDFETESRVDIDDFEETVTVAASLHTKSENEA